MLIDINGTIINLNHVTQVVALSNGGGAIRFTMDEDSCVIDALAMKRLKSMCGMIVQAPPDLSLIQAHCIGEADGDPIFDKVPVIAFRGDPLWPEPVTIDGYPRGDHWAFILPDGQVFDDGEIYENVEAFRDMIKRRDKELAEKNSAPAAA